MEPTMIDMPTPLAIEIALHYWARPERYAWREPEHANSPGVQQIKSQMVKLGLLEPIQLNPSTGDSVQDFKVVEEPMRLYVEALCSVPYPIKAWTMPHAH